MTNKNAQALGKLGGKATLAKYGSKHFSRIRGVNSGWPKGKKRKTTSTPTDG